MINTNTQLNIIIGYPLTHSLTPILHNTVYQLLNINAVCLAHSTLDVTSTMEALKTLSVGLIAVTMPYKQSLMSYVDDMSDDVKKLKTLNTIICRSNKLYGFNTDIDGIAYALREVSLTNKNVLLIGGGGAAKSAAYYLKSAGAHLFYLNRRALQSESLATLFGGKKINADEINDLAIDLIVNATPVGMAPHIEMNPLRGYSFHSEQIVFDMVYQPKTTALIAEARVKGAHTISGLDMFLAQGLKQIELYANQKINRNELIPILKNELKCLHDACEEKL